MHPIGSNKVNILSIRTEKIDLTFRGKTDVTTIKENVQKSAISIACSDVLDSIEVLSNRKQVNEYKYEQIIAPIFLEQTDYELCIEYNVNDNIELVHQNSELLRNVTKMGNRHPYLGGTINFESEIGFSDFVILLNGKSYLKIKLEVFPTKLDYKNDFVSMMKDIEEEVFHLTLDNWKKTYQQMNSEKSNSNLNIEFFEILKKIFQKLCKAINIIFRNTQQKLIIEHQLLPEHKVKYKDVGTVKWATKHSRYVHVNQDGKIHFEKAMGVKKNLSFDTNENRLVKYILQSTLKRLQDFHTYSKKFRSFSSLERIEQMEGILEEYLKVSFLSNVGEYTAAESMSLVFSMAPGYKELYQYYRMLKEVLTLYGSLYHLSVKNTAEVYEYWCFLKFNRILRDNLIERKSNIIQAEYDGIKLNLKRGKESLVEYENPITGAQVRLIYNKKFVNLPTGCENPDILFVISSNLNEKVFIFDAKYRIDKKKNEPKREDIEVMHRYRDSIVEFDNLKKEYYRIVEGCYVLFPSQSESDYVKSKFFQSIQTVNIGGVPFLPNTTKLTRDLILGLIYQNILFRNVENPGDYIDADGHYYIVPETSSTKEKIERLSYIALCKQNPGKLPSKNVQRIAKISHVKVEESTNITCIPIEERKNGEDLFYVFSLESWNSPASKVEVSTSLTNKI